MRILFDRSARCYGELMADTGEASMSPACHQEIRIEKDVRTDRDRDEVAKPAGILERVPAPRNALLPVQWKAGMLLADILCMDPTLSGTYGESGFAVICSECSDLSRK